MTLIKIAITHMLAHKYGKVRVHRGRRADKTTYVYTALPVPRSRQLDVESVLTDYAMVGMVPTLEIVDMVWSTLPRI